MSGADSGPDKVVEVETIRRAHNRVIVKLQGFDTPETAASLRGMEVWVSRQQAAPLAESEYYVADLVGCRAFLWTEEPPIGEVLGVIEGPTDDFLEIGLVGGGSALVPLRDDYVGTVDTAAKRIEILDPDILK
jgi:16S rRNA processing protein RimM